MSNQRFFFKFLSLAKLFKEGALINGQSRLYSKLFLPKNIINFNFSKSFISSTNSLLEQYVIVLFISLPLSRFVELIIALSRSLYWSLKSLKGFSSNARMSLFDINVIFLE